MSKLSESDAVIKEMLPFFIYVSIPLAITIFIAWTFGPSV